MVWACRTQKNEMVDCLRAWYEPTRPVCQETNSSRNTNDRYLSYVRKFQKENPDVNIYTGRYVSEEAAIVGREVRKRQAELRGQTQEERVSTH